MAQTGRTAEKPLHWVASAKKDLLALPQDVVHAFGKGEGSGVLELIENRRGSTWRVVYTVRFERAVYVLHCFQKKSPSGIRTATTDVELVRRRLRTAGEDYEVRYGKKA